MHMLIKSPTEVTAMVRCLTLVKEVYKNQKKGQLEVHFKRHGRTERRLYD